MKRAGDFLLIAARFGNDGQAEHGGGEGFFFQVNGVESVIVVKDIAGMNFFDLGDRADVTCHNRV